MTRAHEPLEATLRRLKTERLDADRLYQDALTALDQAFRPPPEVPDVPPALDEHQVTPLNQSWDLQLSPPQGSGVRARLAGFVWRLVAPYFQRQLSFNSQLVDHVNRNVAASRAAHAATQALAAASRQHFAALAEFQMRLLAYVQQITGYVDTKDRDTGGGDLVLNAALSGMAEEAGKRWESLAARERRYEAKTAAIASAHEDLRAMIGVAQQASLSLKREVERLMAVGAGGSQGSEGSGGSGGSGGSRGSGGSAGPREAFAGALDAYKYVGFEDQFRGSQEAIRERQESYLPCFEGRSDVLDVGCGRGEFVALLVAHGIAARGIDSNHEMVEVCRGRGLEVSEADAVGHLSGLDDGALGGIFAAQVVEHLEPGYLLRFLELAFHKLRPGGRIVLETLNPACWVAFFESYIRDITHAWPLHPETLKYLVVASGFTRARVEYRSPVPLQDRLQPVAVPAGTDAMLADLAETFNANVEKLNARMFTHLDYAVVADKADA
jgi:SAM-dependent methyltransferase